MRPPASGWPIAALLAAWLAAFVPAPAAWAEAPPKFAGTYRIEAWREYQDKGFFHFFYLQPGGAFLLGAEWPGREASLAGGSWAVEGELLNLTGTVRVETNQGRWEAPFLRAYRIATGEGGLRLEPVLQKNRFGLLGWPDTYVYFRTRPSPNLPSGAIPTGESELGALVKTLTGGS